mmetsp:Transcript_10040/g.23223  ORF Transcript_10040/g.23223 Transcript_10040/m.23223 type:complete len:119 (+) Transcript_10040:1418-1774(+)
MVVIAMINVNLLAVVYLAGYTINSITVLLLIMAIGLVADPCLHMVHAFLHVDGDSRTERAEAAVAEMGGSVLLGSMTTFLASWHWPSVLGRLSIRSLSYLSPWCALELFMPWYFFLSC